MKVCSIAVLCVMLATPMLVQAQGDSPPGQSTGQRIGNAVAAAVSTAFPAVSTIIQAIWPNRNEKKTAADAQAKLDAVKKQADADQQKNVAELKQVANDLSITRTFVTSAADVLARISVMQGILSSRSAEAPAQLSDGERSQLQDWWGPARKRIDGLQSDTVGKSLDSLSDNFLKSVFSEIRSSITDNAENISNQLKDGRKAALEKSLGSLAPQFARIGPLTGILIGDIGTAVEQSVVKIGGASGGTANGAAASDRESNLALLKKMKASR